VIKITILTPILNSAGFLEQTLDSLYTQYAIQSDQCHIEHIICDGGSSDGVADIASKYKFSKFYSQTDGSMYDAIVNGLAHSNGDIIGWLNAGDILFPWAFDVLLDVFSNKNILWVTGYSTIINEKNQITASWKPPRYRREFVENGFYADADYPYGIAQESTFWSAELNCKINLKKLRSFKLAGDYFLWTEFAKHAQLHSIMSPLGAFRIHAGQLSEKRGQYLAEAKSCARLPTMREKFTAWWETKCNPLLRGPLWNHTLLKSPAQIFEYDHSGGRWSSR
jgi:glycosyltransferase involved in cell wall biosynthesis